MKNICFLLFVFLASACGKLTTSSLQNAATTKYYLQATCNNIGTGSEGWFINGTLIASGACSNKVIACEGVGTGSEGWYTYTKGSSLTLQGFTSVNCAKSTTQYNCSTNTWYLGSQNLGSTASGSCATDVLSCEPLSATTFNLLTYTISNRALLSLTNCSSQLTVTE